MQQVVVGMIPPPLAGMGLDRIPLFGSSFSSYPDVVVEGYLGRRVWSPDTFVTIGSMVTIENSTWRVVAHADDPVGPPTPIFDECGADYVDRAEALLLLS